MKNKGGRPKSREQLMAEDLGITKKQVQSIGIDRLEAMKPEARMFMISLAKSSRKTA